MARSNHTTIPSTSTKRPRSEELPTTSPTAREERFYKQLRRMDAEEVVLLLEDAGVDVTAVLDAARDIGYY